MLQENNMHKEISARIARVPSSVMLSLAEKIRQLESSGEKIIDLSLGQPEVPAPAHISKAVENSLLNPQTSYSSSAGFEEFRRLIAQDLAKRSGSVDTNSQEIIVTSGSKHALFIALLSLVDPGEEVLVFEPYFPPYAEILGLVEGALKAVPIHSSSDDSLEPDVEEFLSAIGGKTKAVLLNYPNNPAGWTLTRSQVSRVADYCSEKGVYLISDEIYDHIVFDGREHCPAWSFSRDSEYIIHIGSFSKTYSMVPYRLGFLAGRKSVCDSVLKAQRATVTMVSPYIQSAGIAALKGPQEFVKSRLEIYEERRDKCVGTLASAGLACPKPSGAFYLFIPLPKNSRWSDAFEFATKFLEASKVAVLPGGIFGERWKNYVRISFATEDSELFEGMRRFCEFCNS
jgi:aspartate aminotransferase